MNRGGPRPFLAGRSVSGLSGFVFEPFNLPGGLRVRAFSGRQGFLGAAAPGLRLPDLAVYSLALLAGLLQLSLGVLDPLTGPLASADGWSSSAAALAWSARRSSSRRSASSTACRARSMRACRFSAPGSAGSLRSRAAGGGVADAREVMIPVGALSAPLRRPVAHCSAAYVRVGCAARSVVATSCWAESLIRWPAAAARRAACPASAVITRPC